MNNNLENSIVYKNIVDSINKTQDTYLHTCHGSYHINMVCQKAKEIMNWLNFSEKEKEICISACLLHDLGCIYGKENHNLNSIRLSKSLIENYYNSDEKKILYSSILHHSATESIPNKVCAVLAIADKINIQKDRLLPMGLNDEWHISVLSHINDCKLSFKKNKLIINFTSDIPELAQFRNYEKLDNTLRKCSDHLGISYEFRLNDKEYIF